MPLSSLTLRQNIAAMPIVGAAARKLYRTIVPPPPEPAFGTSGQYWDDRYYLGGDSGAGSSRLLARFKAEVINRFVAQNAVQSVVELGSGDGSQLDLAEYPKYTGIDISPRAIEICRRRFARDPHKRFLLASTSEACAVRAELALSLDVIYHLVEEEVFQAYMAVLVSAASRFVCVYSSDFERESGAPHVRHRRFTEWISNRASFWKLTEHIPNPYPESPERPLDTSFAEFFIYRRESQQTNQRLNI